MDILSGWDIHIGKVLKQGLPETEKTIFLACPSNQLNDEYFKELNRLFETGNRISKAL